MKSTSRRFLQAGACALALGFTALFSPAASAASISYGNFGPIAPGITFTDVVESSSTDSVPLYDADGVVNSNGPTPFVVGIDFDPASFGASAAGGGADVTDGQLSFGVEGTVGPGGSITAIQSLSIFERGDYTLFGVGTAATQVGAGIGLNVKITHVDGADVPDINIPLNASVAFNLLANPGIGNPWSLGLTADLDGALTANGVPYVIGATKAEVFLNNTLLAISEPASVALIVKKDFVITVTPDSGIIPEPSTFALAGLALCGLGVRASRKRR
jgi:hypothetical protein